VARVYTQNKIAEQITLQTIQYKIAENEKIENLKILDFGCGTGRFYWSAFQLLNVNFSIPKTEIIKNLYKK
jgi:2-polyprenyl-3-methyl-5-hydroxy-6-metoxy-1,4-benzoquinol methylase